MTKTALKPLSKPKADALVRIRSRLPPATVEQRRNTGKGEGKGLMLTVPEETRRALAVRAAENGTTMRVLVLEALKQAGYPVPDDELIDRRKL